MPKQNPYKNPNIGGAEPSSPPISSSPSSREPIHTSVDTSISSYEYRGQSNWYGILPSIAVAIAILTTLILLAHIPAWVFIIVNIVEVIGLFLLMRFTSFGNYSDEYPIVNIVLLNIISISVIIALCTFYAGEFQQNYSSVIDSTYLERIKFVMGIGGVILIIGTVVASVFGMRTIGSIIAPLSGIGGTCIYISLCDASIKTSSEFLLAIRTFWFDIGMPGVHAFLASIL